MKGTSQIAKIPTRPCRLTGSNPKNLCAVGGPERDLGADFGASCVPSRDILGNARQIFRRKVLSACTFLLGAKVPPVLPVPSPSLFTSTLPIYTISHVISNNDHGRSMAGGC